MIISQEKMLILFLTYGLIDQVEIPIKTDSIGVLVSRMTDNQRILGDRAGRIRIRRIGD